MLSPFLQRLLFVNQFGIDKGKINLLGEREIMLNSAAILTLQEIDESKIYDAAKKSSIADLTGFVDHAKVYKKMKDVFMADLIKLGQKIGKTDEGTIKTLQELFNVYGLGEMVIEKLDNPSKTAIVSIRDSTLALEWSEVNKKLAKGKVCTLTAGVIAGMFSYIFGKNVDCTEISCKAGGKESCLFKVA